VSGFGNGVLTGEPVFVTGGRTYFWEDVILAGAAWGEWTRLEGALRRRVAWLARAAAENAAPTREELDAAITRFRYERNLISAQETRDWLARWDLRPDDWFDYLRRQLVQARAPNDGWDAADETPLSTPLRALYVDAVCSGVLEQLARDLALRAASLALDASTAVDDADPDLVPWLEDDTVLQSACRLGVSPARGRERLALLAQGEWSYNALRVRALNPPALTREVATHALEWTQVACETVTFDDQAAAREALLCLRVDGRTLREVAAAANRSATSERVYLDEGSSVADMLLGAREGDVIGPVASDQRFLVIAVHDRVPASCDDPAIIRRAEASILSRLAASELVPAIKWQKAF
jgi:hypothetical protein